MSVPGLFSDAARVPARRPARHVPVVGPSAGTAEAFMTFAPSANLMDVYARAKNPTDPLELRDLYLGRVEDAVGARSTRPELREAWRSSRPRRLADAEEVLNSRATIRFVKETFNSYFRDDLYGALRSDDHLILSSGSVDEETWGLPRTVKECISFALARDWYGYSDSRGREPAREAIAAYESARLTGARYDTSNVAITLGGTFAVSCLADLILGGREGGSPALCGIPNYPPLLESVARRGSVQLVATPLIDGATSLGAVIEAIRPDTPLVLLQTVTNPTGAMVAEAELERLIRSASPNTMILLDECHECLGPAPNGSAARAAENVVRINSMSKNWSAPGLKVGWIVASTSFIEEYYEYASTTFGGPPSFFYTAIEVLTRMERWRHEGVDDLSAGHLSEFEGAYGLSLGALQGAYDSYAHDRQSRETELVRLRDIATTRLDLANTVVAGARYSINLAVELSDYDSSYLAFRDLLDLAGVSVFPGLLTCCLSDSLIRVTTARRGYELELAVERVRSFLLRRNDQGLANGAVVRARARPAAIGPART